MSWVNGIKDVRLLGSVSGNIEFPVDVLREVGGFYPFVADYREFFTKLVQKIDPQSKDIGEYIGSGNAAMLNQMMYEFIWSSYIENMNWETFEDLLTSSSPVSLLLTVSTLQVVIKNEFTDVKTKTDNFMFLVNYPSKLQSEDDLVPNVAGFFSPAQNIIMSVGNNKFKNTIFHEGIHAITRSAKLLLDNVMYGNNSEEKLEEIITHTLTDKFSTFAKFKSLIDNDVSYDYKRGDNGYQNPASMSFKTSSNGSDVRTLSSHVGEPLKNSMRLSHIKVTPVLKDRFKVLKDCNNQYRIKGKSSSIKSVKSLLVKNKVLTNNK